MDDDSVSTDQRPDRSRTPVLEALEHYRRTGRRPFSPPGHKGGTGVDARVALTLGPDVFASDVLARNGLDDRRMSGRVLERALPRIRGAHGMYVPDPSDPELRTLRVVAP
ncbi:hypothetical protein [Streptomyces akebiae]|uniref:Uncharacterized protein n=1 Tax=Streptomyces akebiae TaxID=2865673 RepID=A0ABX8XKC9_9ACTN|nr:hypothetical protein [Streptomyces akebiae]QYX76375.1 hypothetical protein K1J60_07510 [Streptomyces akebiae]